MEAIGYIVSIIGIIAIIAWLFGDDDDEQSFPELNPVFVYPSDTERTLKMGDTEYVNDPVNIDLVITFTQSKLISIAGDKREYPSIIFVISETRTVTWVYEDEEDRNDDYDWLLDQFGEEAW